MAQVMAGAGSIRRGWHLLAGIAALALITGYIYLGFLYAFAKVLVYAALTFLIASFTGTGGWLLLTAGNTGGGHGDMGNVFQAHAGSYADAISYTLGAILLILGVLMGLILMCMRKRIQIAVSCVQGACECLFDMPSLLLQPLVEVLVKIIVVGGLLYGLGWLLSVGEVTSQSATIGGKTVAGVHRSFEYTEDEKYMVLYYVFGALWIDEVFTAMGQFVVSYSVVLYYFSGYNEKNQKNAPTFPLWRGYGNGFMYHTGTIAFGAAIIAVVRLIRLILSYVAKQADATGNAACGCVAKVCVCLISCFESCLKFLNKTAYMDVAMKSTSFCTAAKNAMKMLLWNPDLVALLNGACFVFQIAGAGLITACGAFVASMVVSHETFSDAESEYYVEQPMILTIAAGIVSLMIAVPFMLVFDQCADTLLYCYVTKRGKGEAPRAFESIKENAEYEQKTMDNDDQM